MRQRALLLHLVALLLLLLFLRPSHPSEAAEQRPDAGADGRTLAPIAPDCAPHRRRGCPPPSPLPRRWPPRPPRVRRRRPRHGTSRPAEPRATEEAPRP